MPFKSPFSTRQTIAPPVPKSGNPLVRTDWRGLDLTSPYDVVAENRTPEAKNFRIYAQEADDRKVSVSSRKGSGFYTIPVGETQDVAVTSTTGELAQHMTTITRWLGMKFEAGVTGPLTRVDVNIRSTEGVRGPVVVEIYTDDAGNPGTKIADSGILGSDITDTYAYVPVRFVEAPTVTDNSSYWIVMYIQDDGEGEYEVSSTTSNTDAKVSISLGLAWESQGFGLNVKTYVSSTATIKGLTRYAPTNAQNKTISAIGTNIYTADDLTGVQTSILSGLSVNASDTFFTFADDKVFIINGYDQLKTWDGTTIETITHGQLPILRLGVFHKDRLFGVDANDPNKLVYSELPGNDDGAGNEWYEAWLSTSFRYVPTPKASDPITAIIPFQDNLYIFTAGGKYVLYGSDPGSFNMRMAMGKKGALNQKSVIADENFIYFAANDGLYRFNGSSDTRISERVQTEYDAIPDINKCVLTKWKKTIRFYYQSPLSGHNDKALLWHDELEEWMMDTDSHVSRAVALTDSNDEALLIEGSSVAPQLTYAEVSWNNMGKAIDYLYKCKNDSMGNPAAKKRIQKFYPLLEGRDTNYTVQVGVDRNNRGTPRITHLPLNVAGEQIGEFDIGDGTLIGGIVSFQPVRLRVSGYSYYWQFSTARKAIENPVQFIGYVITVRAKRL